MAKKISKRRIPEGWRLKHGYTLVKRKRKKKTTKRRRKR